MSPTWIRRLIGVAMFVSTASTNCSAQFPTFDQLPERVDPPDPLVMFDGTTTVKTREDWFQRRRPELKALFEHYMYGTAPAAPATVTAKPLFVDPQGLDGKATVSELEVQFGPPAALPLRLLLIVPNKRTGPVPVFLGLNFCGNHTVLKEPRIQLPPGWVYNFCSATKQDRAADADRGSQRETWCADLLVDRGYALATVYNGDIDPDRPDFTDGIHPHYFRPGQTAPGPNEWGTVRAWSWGLSRVIDHLVTRSELDPQRIAVIGHSRLGKTALLTAALDERVALCVPHQSGTGGMAMSRKNQQETVTRINTHFPHWFNDAFVEFGGHEGKLPIDQHLLVALVAPRPLFDGEGDQDTWANFDNALISLQGAHRVYEFLGVRGLVGTGILRDDQPFNDQTCGQLVQYRRNDKHELNRPYWQRILDFADLRLTAPAKK